MVTQQKMEISVFTIRHIYEQLGCKFAPVEVAAKFSHEKQLPETQGITPFGFHYHLPPGTTL